MNEVLAACRKRRLEIHERGREIDALLAQGIPVEVDELESMIREIQEMRKTLKSIYWLQQQMAGVTPDA